MGKAFRLLLFLHSWIRWEQIVDSGKVTALEKQMTNKRCSVCGLYGCRHVNPRLPPMILSTGENVGEAMSTVEPTVVENDSARVPTIPMGATPESNKRVLVPPPPPVPKVIGVSLVPKQLPPPVLVAGSRTPDYSAALLREPVTSGIIVEPTPAPIGNKDLQSINMKTDWVNCNICRARVYIRYLDMHLKVHTHNFEPSNVTHSGGGTTSTAIVRSYSGNNPTTITTPPPSSFKKESSATPNLSRIETYKFRQLEQACCAASVTRDGRYSDLTIVYWSEEKPGVVNASYTGSTSYTTKDWERFSIHIVYDSVEDYYTLTSKLLKRSPHSIYDNEEACPDRICEQKELFSEIKRALLFFRISPKAAYKHFRRLFSAPMIIQHDDNGKVVFTQSKNCEILQERLKKSSSSSVATTGWTSGRGWDSEHDPYEC